MESPSRSSGAPGANGRHDAKPVKLLALDVDGVLTDGSIMLDDNGVETKRFNVRDGQGIASWLGLGFQAAIITKRCGKTVQHRMRELGVPAENIMQGRANKSEALDELLARTGLTVAEIAYIGDDWPDMPVLRRVGFPIAVGDADPNVKALAALITVQSGGRGAVREGIEHMIKAKGLMPALLDSIMRGHAGPAASA